MTHRTRPPHEDPAFLRREFRGVVTIISSDDPAYFEWTYGRDHVGPAWRAPYGSTIKGMGCLSPLTDARVFRGDDECARRDTERRERELLRAQLHNEAADCWRLFFVNFAPTDTAALVDTNPAPTINWHFADKAREFEAAAAGLVV
jgi:hypothetical protein